MSREIKFRALDIHNKAWHLDYTNVDCMRNLNNPNYVVTQFTGLLDKNGKEIFEGDIVNAQYNICSYFKKVCVYFENGCFYVDDKNPKQNLSIGYFFREKKEIEVIGNIFQNPELLGGQDE
jgi:uncharacterized phage protein (TIGR01671 family)